MDRRTELKLLAQALDEGLLEEADLRRIEEEASTADHTIRPGRWGWRIQLLVEADILSDDDVRRLERKISRAPSSRQPPARPSRRPSGTSLSALTTPAPGPRPSFPEIPDDWERYRVMDLIGEGGMGRVYRAVDPRLRRWVALKFLHGDDPAMVQRFLGEARTQASVEHDEAVDRLAERREALRSLAPDDYDRLVGLSSDALAKAFDDLTNLEKQIASALVRSVGEGPEISSLLVSAAEKKDEIRAEARRLAAEAVPGASQQVYDAFAELKIAEVEEKMIAERKRILNRFMWDYARGRASAPEEEIEYQRLAQEVESNRALYEAFLEQSAAGQIREALEAARAGGRFEIIEPPTKPISPVAPDRKMILLLSLLGGLVAGMAAVLVAEQSDTSFKDVEDIESTLGLSVLATIPESDVLETIGIRERRLKREGRLPTGGNSRLVRYMARETPISFEFRRLARKLSKMGGDGLPKSILVTSSHRGEGKTTVAACLAITLAQHYDRKTVLVDADLRKPRVHHLMEVEARPGLSDAIARGHLLGTDMKKTALPNLSVLPCGTRRDQPTWLLEQLPGSRVMEELLARFDYVILDTAPNVAVPDAVLLGSEVDAVVMVLRAGVTPREVVKRGIELQMEEMQNVLGLVVNNLERVLPYYYDYKYYHYDRDVSSNGSERRDT